MSGGACQSRQVERSRSRISSPRLIVAWVLVAAAVTLLLRTESGERQQSRHRPFAPFVLSGFSATTLEGETINDGWFDGRMTVVNFWATWCAPCRAEIPDLGAVQQLYEGQVQIMGISVDAGENVVREFASRYSVPYHIAMSTVQIQQAFGTVDLLPTTFVVGPDRRVLHKFSGRADKASLVRVLESVGSRSQVGK